MRNILKKYRLLVAAVIELIVVLILHFTDLTATAQIVATVFVGFVIILAAFDMVKQIIRREFELDILAVITMVATLAVGEYIAASIIALMLTGGEALENYAAYRAKRDLRSLLDHAPNMARRLPSLEATPDEAEEILTEDVAKGDYLLVRPSEVVPVNGVTFDKTSVDESSPMGEAAAVCKNIGDMILSGSVNGTQAVRIQASKSAADSQYQRIIALVRQVEDQQAPIVRVADCYTVPFTVVSLLTAAVAWVMSGNPMCFAEVLVLATPCPLLIGASVAFLGGMSRASNAGMVVKGGAVLENLTAAKSIAFDRTGTLTYGRPTVAEIHTGGVDRDQIPAYAAAAEWFSTHVLAGSIIQAADGLELPVAEDGTEVDTEDMEATVDGVKVRVGTLDFIRRVAPEAREIDFRHGQTAAYVTIDNRYAGTLILDDQPRINAVELVNALQHHGFERTVVLTGDNINTAHAVAGQVGIPEYHASLLPQDKVRLLKEMEPHPVIIVGDGINDAPVLATAGIGITMGAHDDTEASEMADVVITRDDISRVARAIDIGRWTLTVAKTAIWTGIVLSVALMLVAAFGYIPAVVGALLQEVIDLATILYALRALKGGERVKVTAEADVAEAKV